MSLPLNDIESERSGRANQSFFSRQGYDAIRQAVRFSPADRHTPVEMQFARTPIIIEPISHVIILLNFHQHHAAAYRMHCSGGYLVEAARLYGFPLHQCFNAAVMSGGAQFLGRKIPTHADTEPRIRGCIQHIPAF
ncbi:hypothetical protein A0J57_24335 [Sphingobium sp. 22B]|nr:hypothetical protein AXW74_23905 [Sphingobium sp. AM]KYC29724.1 hypothetical protein A0J57_24335 [Sphingobium sp. 22B]OAP29293.1 hypothetical protein A8O16_24400 [Sphingobium sp. 20006FA]